MRVARFRGGQDGTKVITGFESIECLGRAKKGPDKTEASRADFLVKFKEKEDVELMWQSLDEVHSINSGEFTISYGTDYDNPDQVESEITSARAIYGYYPNSGVAFLGEEKFKKLNTEADQTRKKLMSVSFNGIEPL